MRLESVGAPDASHSSGICPQVIGQCASAPVSRSFGSLLERHALDLLDFDCRSRGARPARPRRILQQSVHTRGEKACTPARCNTAIGVEFLGDVLVRHSVVGEKHYTSAKLNSRLNALALGKNSQASVLVGTQLNWLGDSHGIDLQLTGSSTRQLSSVIYGALHLGAFSFRAPLPDRCQIVRRSRVHG